MSRSMWLGVENEFGYSVQRLAEEVIKLRNEVIVLKSDLAGTLLTYALQLVKAEHAVDAAWEKNR